MVFLETAQRPATLPMHIDHHIVDEHLGHLTLSTAAKSRPVKGQGPGTNLMQVLGLSIDEISSLLG